VPDSSGPTRFHYPVIQGRVSRWHPVFGSRPDITPAPGVEDEPETGDAVVLDLRGR